MPVRYKSCFIVFVMELHAILTPKLFNFASTQDLRCSSIQFRETLNVQKYSYSKQRGLSSKPTTTLSSFKLSWQQRNLQRGTALFYNPEVTWVRRFCPSVYASQHFHKQGEQM